MDREVKFNLDQIALNMDIPQFSVLCQEQQCQSACRYFNLVGSLNFPWNRWSIEFAYYKPPKVGADLMGKTLMHRWLELLTLLFGPFTHKISKGIPMAFSWDWNHQIDKLLYMRSAHVNLHQRISYNQRRLKEFYQSTTFNDYWIKHIFAVCYSLI